MPTGIMIIGPSGSGKTTLGKIVAQKLGYPYFDVDDYIWKQNTDSPYTQMYTRDEKISRLSNDIAPYEHFVMAGSMSSFHYAFDEMWNKQNAIQPAIPNNPEGEWITLPTDSMRAYFDLCIIKYFLNVISPNNDMQSKITWLFIRFPEIDLKALGFPQGWETEPLWR